MSIDDELKDLGFRPVRPTKSAGGQDLVGFSSMHQVIEYARSGAPLFYKAPMDRSPTRLGFSVQFKVLKKAIRIIPPKRDADPFTADAGHLDRFLRPA